MEKWLAAWKKEYLNCIQPLLRRKEIRSMKQYRHHLDTDGFCHCMHVSCMMYMVCKLFRLDYKAAARAGLLHDFFLYDWHDYFKQTHSPFHLFTHAGVALNNANRYFVLTNREQDMIKNHMWPVTVFLPKYKETYLLTIIDKICSILEIFQWLFSKIRSNLYNVGKTLVGFIGIVQKTFD